MEHTWNDRSISTFTSEESSLIGTTSQKLIDRILDAEDSLSTHVNDLTIKDWKPEKDGTDVLCKILNNLKDRESFRRLELDILIAKDVLDLFHSRFSEARLLSQTLPEAWRATKIPYDMSMDIALLISPQLYSLEYGVLYKSPRARISEFPVSIQVILQAITYESYVLPLYLILASSSENNIRSMLSSEQMAMAPLTCP
ncbi:hypothetical protein WAI453_002739 [Rhynchosporium graminicola]|uniref:Uncharacterized protein n=1 Tax=Rhynchosporium graminicola TaxID=2792576 RepID=A0A1E1JUQ7_9HELO|nr:uncharacterized protein RCO7_02519 [Rhynchosporium commune]